MEYPTEHIHGEYNERKYTVLLQRVHEDGRTEWSECFSRTAHELKPAGALPDGTLSADRMRRSCKQTCHDIAEEQDAKVGDIMYLPYYNPNGEKSETPAGHMSW